MTPTTQVEMAERLGISASEWEVVAEILATHLAGKTVWAFGSRATGLRVRRFSDLDLAVEQRLADRGGLMEAFDESPLSFKVDVVELCLVESAFRERVERDFVVVQSSGPGVN